ncbi:F-box/FBD/LRR-repeat protein [Carex littledalei]|uniref:F-box/FBD/LRR-repeat protein n=1 Tax=Carex littledalei TaxID=544730 RepID=A0A833RF42_9POAL|nr:F-box/FBD/LRR-repeat protein [Carex littledalei]
MLMLMHVDVDRISEFVDDLLVPILSLLSTKEAVQISLLAKRFQNLWTAVPVLDFDFDKFCPDVDTLDNLEEDKGEGEGKDEDD